MNDIVPANETTDLAELSPNSLAFVMPGDFPDLESAEVGMSIEKKYFEFNEKGKKVRAVFNGMDSITTVKNGGRNNVPAIVFQTREGVFLNSGASLVEQFKTIPPGTPVQIEYLGDVKTNSGNNVKKFDVRLLNMTVKVHTVKQDAPKDEYKNTDRATEYWTLAKSMRFTQEEGLAHLKTFDNDFAEAIAAMQSFN